MSSKSSSAHFLIITLVSFTILIKQSSGRESFSPYNELSFQKEIIDLRERFLRKNIEKKKLQILDEIMNNTVYVDGIPHVNIEKSVIYKQNIIAMENGFRSLLNMDGVKFTYKRGFHWRTLRRLEYKGNKTVVCYKCNSVGSATCKNCSSGFWSIEDKPPCPYEILSMVNDRELCAVNITEYSDWRIVCPALISFNDFLISCDNPMKTEWRITSNYSKRRSESILKLFCGQRESCEVLTTYTVSPDYVIFRIVNATHHIIYSRVMKSGRKNYACVQNCGRIDTKTEAIMKNENPVILDLLSPIPSKNKREYCTDNTINTPKTHFKKRSKESILQLFVQNNHLIKAIHITKLNKRKHEKAKRNDILTNTSSSTTKSLCKKLQDKYNEADRSETIED